MSGHSKWHSIKHKKGALDAKRGKIFTKHAKLITIAAREGGGDPDMNPGLRTAIANAKFANVPNVNIDKAVKKGAGGDKDGIELKELMYEGFGPVGTTMYVQVITDNTNRSVANVKTVFNKNGGNMGEAGTVAYMYDKKGLILATAEEMDPDEAELGVIDAGAEDLEKDGDIFQIITAFENLMSVRDNLEKAGFKIEKAEISYIPKTPLEIENLDDAKKVIKLVEALEDDEDVTNVFSNFDISKELLEQLD